MTTTTTRLGHVAGALVLGLAVSACGSAATGTTTAEQQQGQQQQGQGQRGFARHGANGQVAAVSGSTAQVQSQQSGQVAVTWTARTSFTRQVAATKAAVKVGECGMVTGSGSSSATDLTAASVRIVPAGSEGTCTFGGGGRSGAPGGQPGGTPPTGEGARTGQPSPPAGAGSGGRGFGGAFGEVTKVSSSGFTVASTGPGASDQATTSTVSVRVAASTSYTTTAKASASDVKVGACMRAEGTADDTGAVTATTVALSTAVKGSCEQFGRPGGGGA